MTLTILRLFLNMCRYIASELCIKWTLKEVIGGKYKGPPLGPTREILRQIISGVQHLHEHNIVHRW